MSTGDDNHSDNAVRLMQDLLKNTNIPCYVVDSEYGAYQRHCFTENAREDLLIGAFTYSSARFPKAVARMEKSAPPGADTKSWKY